MLMRISLILAILAGLAVGALSFVQVKDKITTLKDQRDTEQKAKEQAQSDLAKAKSDLDKSTKALKSTQQELAGTKTERDKAVAEAAVQIKKANEYSNALDKVTVELKDKSANLEAYVLTGRKPQEILNFDKMLKQTQENLDASVEEKKVLAQELKKTQVELAKYEQPNYHVPLPPDLRGKVLVADPKWDFVVLNVGEGQGVLRDGELLVNRDGRLVAKVSVSSVQKDRCIANVMPGWKLGEIIEGDLVIPAYPGS